MSNSTRQGGYDERLVVPLEASRRGAHRARTSPLLAALPLLVVVLVVAAVIGVAYALFLKPSGDTSATDPLTTSPTSPGATSAPSSTAQPTATSSKSSSASGSSASSKPAATVDKTTAVTVYNGTTIPGLAGRVTTALKGQGFSGAAVNKNAWRGSTAGETTVFYAKEGQSATAAAIAKALGGKARLSTSDAANDGIVVVAFSEPK